MNIRRHHESLENSEEYLAEGGSKESTRNIVGTSDNITGFTIHSSNVHNTKICYNMF